MRSYQDWPFRKSSYSTTAQECVEVADLPGCSAVRDTKTRTSGALVFGSAEWAAFVTGVKEGGFD